MNYKKTKLLLLLSTTILYVTITQSSESMYRELFIPTDNTSAQLFTGKVLFLTSLNYGQDLAHMTTQCSVIAELFQNKRAFINQNFYNKRFMVWHATCDGLTALEWAFKNKNYRLVYFLGTLGAPYINDKNENLRIKYSGTKEAEFLEKAIRHNQLRFIR